MTAPFADRLVAAVERTQNPSVVGLDPHLDLLPEEYGIARDETADRATRARATGDFLLEVIEVAATRVPAVKPQSAFFELFGADGAREFERVVSASRDAGLLVIGDVKRGDIGSTAAAYARAFLSGPDSDRRAACDAITINPYLGTDSITPFLEECRREGAGVYTLVRTSNPSSAEFQAARTRDEGGEDVALSDLVADAVVRWGSELVGDSGWSSVGAVVGATHPDELARLRARMPRTPLLLPGYGAQGAGATDVVGGFSGGLHGALVSSSRGVLFAGRQRSDVHWKDATRDAIDAMAAELRSALLG
ncbi:MAG: orotidine-5'-phosphate decarboxylase [Planctomycetota bacterium]